MKPVDLQLETLLAAVRSEYPTLYRAWFDGLRFGEGSPGEVLILADDIAQAHFLRESCAQAFLRCAMQLTGMLMPVRFECAVRTHRRIDVASRFSLRCMPLNADYVFDQFVVGASNRMAHAACRAVCSQPGSLYNPLFIYGHSGLGKTHLLQATCQQLLADDPTREVLYVSCETFVNSFVSAIEAGAMLEFRESTRDAGALVIDDVQFLANRDHSQEELFHTFNALYQSRRQIILSADSAPSDIPTLQDRLVSRFNWGLVAQIDTPSRETRQAILQKKARLRGVEVSAEVLDFIAVRVESNIRLLEGALTKLISETQIGGKPMTLETAREVLDSFDGRLGRPLQINDILDVISQHFRLKLGDLVGRKRARSVSFPRQVGMYLARRLTPLSLEEIGDHFGGRDHSTVLHAERVIEGNRTQDRETAELLTSLTKQLLSRR